jgi:hypothetical protein
MADCVRRAWLTLGTLTQPLEDADAGYYCTKLDLGYPDVRDVVNNKPDMDGVDDRTQFWGSRAVTADITARPAPGSPGIDAVAASFAPYMVPNVRPVLHWVLDRPGTPERILTVRASDYSWPIDGTKSRAIQLAWVAADPVARDPTVHTVVAMAGSSTTAGRTYNLTFPRTYPPGGGSPTTGIIFSPGDTIVRPLIRVYGPITAAWVWGEGGSSTTGNYYHWDWHFNTGFVIDAGHWVDIDAARRTVYRDSDPAQSVYSSVNWSTTTWPVFLPQMTAWLYVRGTTTTGVTQAQAIWQDGYLS